MRWSRYAIYFLPPENSVFSDLGAAWLGWDVNRGAPVRHPDISGLPAPVAELTARPRKYGFHATLKPPFRLQPDRTADELQAALTALCATRPALRTLPMLQVTPMGRFLALRPAGPAPALDALAFDLVRGLDQFRAPPSEAELDRRRGRGLSDVQEANLRAWGYPYVGEAFRFHMTLTGLLARDSVDPVAAILSQHFAPALVTPFTITEVALCGEDSDGRFHTLCRVALSG